MKSLRRWVDLISSAPADFICIADFVSKLQIALKECYETEYWLELMQKAELLSEEIAKVYLQNCGSIRRILITSINTVKENTK